MLSPAQLTDLQRMVGMPLNTYVLAAAGTTVSSTHKLLSHEEFSAVSELHDTGVILQPTPELAKQMFRHYQRLKQNNPHSLGACALIPVRWSGRRWRSLLANWVHVGTMRLAAGHKNKPEDLQVWVDKPVATLKLRAHQPTGYRWTNDPAPSSVLSAAMQHSLTFQFTGQVAGLKADVLTDSGASDVYIARGAVQRAGLPEIPALKRTVELGDGHAVTTCSSTVQLPVKIGAYRAKVTAHVLDSLVGGFDLILGDSWLRAVGAIVDYGRNQLRLKQGRRLLTLVPRTKQQSPLQMASTMAGGEAAGASKGPPRGLLTAKRMFRELVRAGARGDQAFFVMVRAAEDVEKGTLGVASASGSAGHGPAEPEDPTLMPTAAVRRLQQQYSDVLVEELPPGEPPDRGVVHTVQLLPGSKPPSRPLYRMSPRELEEVKRQVAELLAKGLIEPSQSPFASPVLFVQKKDGTLRMCIDYRALNRITVRNQWPLPRIDVLLDSLHSATILSTLDLASGYHQIRISEEDRPKTAFRTPMGLYQFKVLSFGLTNAPSTFAAVMHKIFGDLLHRKGCGVLIYLDDVLVYSRTAAEHEEMLEEVLKRLRRHKLYAKASKCNWNKPELPFLGHIVGRHGTKVDPAKVAAVAEWPRPKSLTELRSFLGLANYFRRFMRGYAQHTSPLNQLLSGSALKQGWQESAWGMAQQQAFDWVKNTLTTAPTLASPDYSKPFVVTTDASVLGIGAVLEQDGRPVAFESRGLIDAETRYTTTEQEMLAVVHALKVWRCFLEGGAKFVVRTDHNPNTFFSTKLQLSRREARWSEFLQQFDFEWQYMPGKTNAVADPLSRHPREAAGEAHGLSQAGAMSLCVCARQLVLASLNKRQIAARKRVAAQKAARAAAAGSPDVPAEVPGADEVLQEYREQAVMPVVDVQPPPAAHASKDMQTADMPQGTRGKAKPPLSVDPARPEKLLSWVAEAYATDLWFADPANTAQLVQKADGLWWKGSQVAISSHEALVDAILWEAHDSPAAGHMGEDKTLHRVQSLWWWPTLKQDVKAYVARCDSCQRMKSGRKNRGALMPLPIPDRPWESVSMDFVCALPWVEGNKYDAILVFVDRLTKMVHLAPCNMEATAETVARLFVHHVWRLHGLPRTLVTDRDPRFTQPFFAEVARITGVKQCLSTAYHPQSDGQTERMNRFLEDVLRHYVAPGQHDWHLHLDAAEFAINSAKQASTQASPFMLNYGQMPYTPHALLVDLAKPERRSPGGKALVQRIADAVQHAKQCLRQAQDRMKANEDRKRDDSWKPAVGDRVLLSTKNMSMYGSSKLAPNYVGPFVVLKEVNPVAFQLELTNLMGRMHDVFHISLLKPYIQGPAVTVKPPPVLKDKGGAIYEVERLLAHRRVKVGSSKSKDGTARKPRMVVEYLVHWKGYDDPADHSWSREAWLVGGAPDLLDAYWANPKEMPVPEGADPVGESVPSGPQRRKKRTR